MGARIRPAAIFLWGGVFVFGFAAAAGPVAVMSVAVFFAIVGPLGVAVACFAQARQQLQNEAAPTLKTVRGAYLGNGAAGVLRAPKTGGRA